jgi:hypothetical protein
MRAGIDLDLGLGAAHALLDLLDDLGGRVDVGLGAGEIELGPGLAGGEMRAVVFVGRQMRSVDRGGGLDAVGKVRGRVDGVTAAHAIADGTDDFRIGSRLALGIGEQGPGVLHDHENVERGHELEHALALGCIRIGRQRAELHHAGAVIEVRQHHVIAGGGEPARHVAQLLADRRRIHVEQDDRKRPAAFGMGDEGCGVAVLGGNRDLLIDHLVRLLILVMQGR